MKYPKFLQNNSTIGITAPSSGVGYKLEAFDFSLNHIRENGWKIKETSNVRSMEEVSSPPEVRAKEFHDLMQDDSVDAIMCASGGDFLTDMLPYVDLSKIKEKWVMGYSDPTNLLYLITTSLDIATLYGHNAGSFDSKDLYESQKMPFEYLKGNWKTQNSYPFHEDGLENRIDNNYDLSVPTEWIMDKPLEVEGRIIGGCIDCLRYLPGTKYDHTKEFIERYKEDGFIWYFDVFAQSTEDFYLTLFQLRESGWFEHAKAILVGRVLFPNTQTTMTYERALKEILPDIPAIMDVDIGHVAPKMTIVNGSIAKVTCKDKKGTIEQFQR